MKSRRGRSIASGIVVLSLGTLIVLLVLYWQRILEHRDAPRGEGRTAFSTWIPDTASCAEDSVRRRFFVGKRRFILGEPILVEFRTVIDGSGGWEGGLDNYSNLRNQDFCLLLRDEIGSWVTDRFPARPEYRIRPTPARYPVSGKHPGVYWIALQQYAKIERAGEYELHCLRQAGALAERDGPVDSEFLESLPGDVLEEAAREEHVFNVEKTIAYAWFRIRIETGDATILREMRDHYREIAKIPHEDESPLATRGESILDGFKYSLDSAYVDMNLNPKIWLEETGSSLRRLYCEISPDSDRWEATLLEPSEIDGKIRDMISSLSAGDATTRSSAFFHLRLWTGESFGHDWEGHDPQRPNRDEGRKMQSRWRVWYDRNH